MNIPEVEAVTHVALMWRPRLQIGDEYISGSGMEADTSFFNVFPQYRIVEGNIKDFVGKNDVLVSESLARRIAPEGESVVGRIIEVGESKRTVKGVFADFDGTFFVPLIAPSTASAPLFVKNTLSMPEALQSPSAASAIIPPGTGYGRMPP